MAEISDENLIRVMSGKKMLMNWRCRFGWHRWSTWTHDKKTLNPMTFESNGTGYMHTECVDCNMLRVERPFTKSVTYPS